ncbi:uncharacterized protein EI90DRAFT_3144153 [Cantharellus anzutake]|uniref:uncharacterized protein n=1 Tax=Cantharellus anzutake TaxID=1750568 RepID=UPI00190807CF|nr:uncharacterized protein EI90DRAFT_3144153 [Cantharellus anzutake]KAF8338723.1 hypothetical protein EI90DRAFT_3144153 [Cantharellus anzutake]
MEDDFGFSSVWQDTTPRAVSPPLPELKRSALLSFDDAFDDKEDDALQSTISTVLSDELGDEFGDFGDFGDAQTSNAFDGIDSGDFPSTSFTASNGFDPLPADPGPSSGHPLRLRPMPPLQQLSRDVEELFEPMYGHIDPMDFMTNEGIRQAEGDAQILVTPESRKLYDSLISYVPPTQQVNWTRSRIRRRHLIELGIPVNLDEVLPQPTALKGLPTLRISTRPMSAPPGPRLEKHLNGVTGNRSSQSRTQTPQGSPTAASSLKIGSKPVLDKDKIDRVLSLDPDTLPLLSVTTLMAHLETLQALTLSTSELLSYLLQQRDALQQDSEAYNKLIGGLVVEAQKMKSGAKGKASSMRGSTFT